VKRIKLIIFIVSMLVLLIVVGVVVNMLFKNEPEIIEPQNLFEEKFKFRLPNSAKFINEEYQEDEGWEDFYDAKISFNKKDYYYLKKNFSRYFKSLGYGRINDYDYLPVSFDDEDSEWGIKEKENEVKLAYMAIVSGKKAKTKYLYAVITKNKNGEYFLYVAH
jgi:hypothetical protein